MNILNNYNYLEYNITSTLEALEKAGAKNDLSGLRIHQSRFGVMEERSIFLFYSEETVNQSGSVGDPVLTGIHAIKALLEDHEFGQRQLAHINRGMAAKCGYSDTSIEKMNRVFLKALVDPAINKAEQDLLVDASIRLSKKSSSINSSNSSLQSLSSGSGSIELNAIASMDNVEKMMADVNFYLSHVQYLNTHALEVKNGQLQLRKLSFLERLKSFFIKDATNWAKVFQHFAAMPDMAPEAGQVKGTNQIFLETAQEDALQRLFGTLSKKSISILKAGTNKSLKETYPKDLISMSKTDKANFSRFVYSLSLEEHAAFSMIEGLEKVLSPAELTKVAISAKTANPKLVYLVETTQDGVKYLTTRKLTVLERLDAFMKADIRNVAGAEAEYAEAFLEEADQASIIVAMRIKD